MFVHYSNTKAEFIAAGLATTYNNNIVFIKGDANGNGSCIYTHGTYFANFNEFLAAVNYVKGVKVGDSQYNATAGGGYIPFASGDNSTVALNVENGTITVGLTDAFVNKVNNTATNLGTKDDAANSEGSAFARIANLAQLVSDLTGGSVDSIEGQITKAIDALRTEITGDLSDTSDAKTLAAINDELNAIDANYAVLEPRVKAIEDDYLKAADKTELEGKIKDNTDAIAVLNGNDTVDGSVDKKIKNAINDFATKVTDNNTIDTIKELVDYVAGVDGSDKLSNAISQINDNKGAIETLNGGVSTAGSVDKKVKDAIDAEVARANDTYATKAQGEKADSAYQKPADGIAKADFAEDVQNVITNAYTDSTVRTTNSKYMYISNESEAGNLYVTIDAEVKAVADATTDDKDGLASSKDVKTYVDAQWEWEEL